MNVYVASDYAGLEVGGLKFYYGFEYLRDIDPSFDPDADIGMEDSWGFYIKKEKDIVMNFPVRRLKELNGCPDDEWDCSLMLLFGIGIFLEWLDFASKMQSFPSFHTLSNILLEMFRGGLK